MQLGTVSVIAFFGLSGFLLAGTRARRSRRTFAWHRFLRIAPGLLVNLAVMAVIVVPLAGLMSGTPADPGHVIRWIQSILTADIVPPTVPGLYGSGVLPDVANASLWTLSIEIWCYVILWAAPARFVWVALAVMGGFATGFHLVDDDLRPCCLATRVCRGRTAGARRSAHPDAPVRRDGRSDRDACGHWTRQSRAGRADHRALSRPVARACPARPVETRPVLRGLHLRVAGPGAPGHGRPGSARVHPLPCRCRRGRGGCRMAQLQGRGGTRAPTTQPVVAGQRSVP